MFSQISIFVLEKVKVCLDLQAYDPSGTEIPDIPVSLFFLRICSFCHLNVGKATGISSRFTSFLDLRLLWLDTSKEKSDLLHFRDISQILQRFSIGRKPR